MLPNERDGKILDPRERELIVAYLSYALEDVRAISEVGSRFLQLTISTLTDEAATDDAAIDAASEPLRTTPTH
jgi:hypothetical protein